MAVTITQQPITPNAAYTKLIYVVSGSGTTSNPQYQYVLDTYPSGSTDRISRLFTPPNPTGVGVFEISRILQDQLQYDNYWKITGSIAPQESLKTFDIRFGEAYSTSISSSVTIFTGSTPNYIQVFPGTVNPNEGSFNFLWQALPDNLPNTWDAFYPFSNFFIDNVELLSVVPLSEYKEVEVGDYETLSFPSDIILPSVGPLGRFRVLTYDSSGTLLQTSAYISASDAFQTLGVGPQNLIDLGGDYAAQMTGSWDRYTIQSTSPAPSTTFTGEYRFKKRGTCYSEYTRFAFINIYGFWDYYNVYNPSRKITDVNRKTFDRPNVDYSSNTSVYDITRRGETQYNTAYSDRYEITTDLVDKTTADWLTELLDSPEVYVQENGEFIPIIITNSTYTWNMNQYRQKQFQYTIQYQLANKRYDR